jgi:hypothetical protein
MVRLVSAWVATLLIACGRAPRGASPPEPGPDQVHLLVVLDGVRADRTSLCGHPRETTRYLVRLRDELRASTSCTFYAPSPLATPAIGSLVSGLPPASHGLDARFVGASWSAVETLAERYAGEGWKTVLVTGKPELAGSPGAADGFEDVFGAEAPLRGTSLIEGVQTALGAASTRPLFLMVVISDALPPWPAITEDLALGPPRPPLDLRLDAPGQTLRRFLAGGGRDAERDKLIESARAHYDAGVRSADALVRDTLNAIERRRGTRDGVRALIVGGTGYMLGEKNTIGQSAVLWEPMVRLPFVFFDTSREARFPPLPDGPYSTLLVHDLLLTGVMPRPLPEVTATSAFDRSVEPTGEDMVALWGGTGKMLWWRGVMARYALADDPDERQPKLPYTADVRPRMEALVPDAEAWMAWRDAELARRGLAAPPRPPVEDPLP